MIHECQVLGECDWYVSATCADAWGPLLSQVSTRRPLVR